MPRYTCRCGATYRFAESSVGKRAKCKQCGSLFTLCESEEETVRIADEPTTDGVSVESQAAARLAASMKLPGGSLGGSGVESVEDDAKPATYLDDLVGSLAFVADFGNLLAFLFLAGGLWFSSYVLSYGGTFGLLGSWIIYGWYCGFRFAVIVDAAAGEKTLPVLSPGDGLWDGILVPAGRWFGTWLVVLGPALAAAIVVAGTGVMSVSELQLLISRGIPAIIRGDVAPATAILLALAGAGVFMWPIIALCVAVGGFPALARLDLILVTVARTFPAYLLTVALVVGAELLEATFSVFGEGWGIGFVRISAALYLEIFALRMIGLYYHHFKSRFAWSWE